MRPSTPRCGGPGSRSGQRAGGGRSKASSRSTRRRLRRLRQPTSATVNCGRVREKKNRRFTARAAVQIPTLPGVPCPTSDPHPSRARPVVAGRPAWWCSHCWSGSPAPTPGIAPELLTVVDIIPARPDQRAHPCPFATVRARLAAKTGDHEVIMPMGEPATDQQLILVGLRPETSYEVSVDAVDLPGSRSRSPASPDRMRSGRLPRDFPLYHPRERPRNGPRTASPSCPSWRGTSNPMLRRRPSPARSARPATWRSSTTRARVGYRPMPQGALDARDNDDGYLFTYDETVSGRSTSGAVTLLELAGRVATEINPYGLQREGPGHAAGDPADGHRRRGGRCRCPSGSPAAWPGPSR